MKVGRSVLIASLLLSHLPRTDAFAPRGGCLGRVPYRQHLRNVRHMASSPVTGEEPQGSETKSLESLPPPPSSQQQQQPAFVNDGPFAWMQPFLDIIGFVPGNTMVGAVPINATASATTSQNKLDETQWAARRQQATEALQNIGPAERERRDQVGNVFLVLSAVYATWASLLADHGGWTGHVLRALLSVPLTMAVGYKLSAQQGL